MEIIATHTMSGLRAVATALICLALLASSGAAHAEGGDEPVAASAEGVVNINTATVEQLRLLPRVGEEKAGRIITHREKTPFKTVNELARVRGIGLKTLRALKPWLSVSGPTTLMKKAVLKSKKSEGESGAARNRGSAGNRG